MKFACVLMAFIFKVEITLKKVQMIFTPTPIPRGRIIGVGE
jgi:hypothetical protein